MKNAFLVAMFVLSAQSSMACLGEAQIVARVSSYSLVGSTSCTVFIDPNSITHYKKNAKCPLDVHAVFQNGFEVGVRREDTCRFEVGDTLKGVLVQDANGTLQLEDSKF